MNIKSRKSSEHNVPRRGFEELFERDVLTRKDQSAKSKVKPFASWFFRFVAFCGLLGLSFLVACASSSPRFVSYDGTTITQAELDKVLAENLLGPSDKIKSTTLGQGRDMSDQIVQIRDREAPHIHKSHDSTVVMVKGRGYLVMETRRIYLSVGDAVFIPRGVVHYYVNTSSEPTVAFVVFSPPFDGTDNIPVTTP